MLLRLLPTLTGAALLCAPASAQSRLAFPLEVSATDTALGTVTLTPDAAAIAELAGQSQVQLTGLYLPGGELIDVELSRQSVERLRLGFYVDGAPAGDLTEGLDLSIWRGNVSGEPGSEVYLSFSNSGCRGWIQSADELIHLMPQPDANGNWQASTAMLVSEATLQDLGNSLGGFCEYDSETPLGGESQVPTPRPADSGPMFLGACTTRDCAIALETDFQLFGVFGDLAAETSYVTTLLTYASNRYDEQINTVLTFPYVQFYTTPSDPWAAGDNGGSSVDMLYEFQAAWVGNIPQGARLAHFLSGASLGGGVAWLDVLCDNTYNFSVSGNIDGQLSFPIQQQPNNWDFIVFTHELGHNFGTPHTHDYCPPLDECAPNGYFGSCQTGQVCTNSGTIMSYCHLCSGGTANVTTYFHPTAVAVMTAGAANCLPLYGGSIAVTPPTVLSPTLATPVQVEISGVPTGQVEMWYRLSGGNYSSISMTNVSGSTYTADLPPAACGSSPEFYFTFTDSSCGPVSAPAGAPGSVFTAAVGAETISFADDFESNTGWTSTNLGASTGDWERGVPVNDGGWAYDPAADFDGSGSCYLTMNQAGNTDIDGGAVQLTSPALDLSSGTASLNYAYYLYLTNEDGTDQLLVELSSNGTAGPWTTIAVHNTSAGTSWRESSITAADLAGLGVAPSANTVVRFTANDTGTGSIVEAGIDAFEVVDFTCGSGGGPTAYCAPGNPNSVSSAGVVLTHLSGTPGGLLTLQVENTPLQPGVLFYGSNQIDQPFGCGRRCVGGGIVRSGVYMPSSGTQSLILDTTGSAGLPFNLQYWYRDPANSASCGNSFNLSNGLGY